MNPHVIIGIVIVATLITIAYCIYAKKQVDNDTAETKAACNRISNHFDRLHKENENLKAHNEYLIQENDRLKTKLKKAGMS